MKSCAEKQRVGRQRGTVELNWKESQIVDAVCALNKAMPTGAAQADASKVFGEFATKGAFVITRFICGVDIFYSWEGRIRRVSARAQGRT